MNNHNMLTNHIYHDKSGIIITIASVPCRITGNGITYKMSVAKRLNELIDHALATKTYKLSFTKE